MAIPQFRNYRMVLKRAFYFLFLLFLAACTSGKTSAYDKEEKAEVNVDPETLYILHCEACHGLDGKKGTSNAADLSKSKLSDKKILNIILNGNDKGMMPYKEVLGSQKAAVSLAEYVKTLRK